MNKLLLHFQVQDGNEIAVTGEALCHKKYGHLFVTELPACVSRHFVRSCVFLCL